MATPAREATTTREAMTAMLLEDMDGLLLRVEAFSSSVTNSEQKIAETVAALDAAGEKYRLMVAAFTQEAKAELSNYMEQKIGGVVAKTAEEQRGAMQEAARLAFRSEASEKASNLGAILNDAAKEFRRSSWSRVMEHLITAMAASCFTAFMVYVIIK